jgi:hypothetical protein
MKKEMITNNDKGRKESDGQWQKSRDQDGARQQRRLPMSLDDPGSLSTPINHPRDHSLFKF